MTTIPCPCAFYYAPYKDSASDASPEAKLWYSCKTHSQKWLSYKGPRCLVVHTHHNGCQQREELVFVGKQSVQPRVALGKHLQGKSV